MYGIRAIQGLMLAGLIGLTSLLAGCGGGGAAGINNGTTNTGNSNGTTSTANLALTLTDPATGNASSTLASGSPLTLTALVKDATGAVAPNSVVKFTTDTNYGAFSPASGTALTNTNGIATITLVAGSTTGAATVSAAASIGTTSATNSIGYSVNVAQLGLSSLSFGTSPLSAYGTSNVTVTVTSGGATYTTPTTVNFTSTCATSGKAVLSSSASTVNGLATASYRDNGCGATDTITATLTNGATSTGNLTVTSPAVSSVQFVSASPINISVKGMGGTEVSTVTFKVVDSGGNPISGKTVNFSLDTTVGGLSLSSNSDITGTNGQAVALINSGTILTPVRVTATTAGTSGNISSQSSQLYVSTMIPDQAHFSLSAEKRFLEALHTDGVTTTVTARLADRSGNPVPDGTAVVFTAEGGSIQPSCTNGTVGGVCTVTWTSQNPRPSDGRATILAYAIGEESFTDTNGNGRYDLGEPFADLGEAYRDDNENGSFDLGSEIFIDFNSDHIWNAGDGLFTGVLCNSGCSATNTLNVRDDSLVLTFSGSTPKTPIIAPSPIDLGGCNNNGINVGSIATASLTVKDVNGNSLPVGTTVSASLANNGKLVGSSSFTVPANGATAFTVRIQNDATITTAGTPPVVTCADATPSGTLTVTVKTPGGIETSDVVVVSN
jgi:hypothetical protein